MSATPQRIKDNLSRLRDRIAAAAARAGRDGGEIRLVVVTKSVGIDEVKALLDLGITELGENRVENARPKIEMAAGAPCWHMIGNIQRRKVRDVVELFDRVDAVDRMSLAEALERRCVEAAKQLPVLIEVNVSGEAAKHGFAPDEAREAHEAIGRFEHLRVEGLMTMAPAADTPEETRPVFAALRGLGADLGLTTLSMGMSNDFEVAIEEGATEVRIGSALFK